MRYPTMLHVLDVGFDSFPHEQNGTILNLFETTTHKKDQRLVVNTYYRFMQVKSIAECFQPSLTYHLSLRSLFCLFLSGRFTQVLLYTTFLNDCTVAIYSAFVLLETNNYETNMPLMIRSGADSGYLERGFVCKKV